MPSSKYLQVSFLSQFQSKLSFSHSQNNSFLPIFCREAISSVCERRGIDVDTINVYLENAVTPLPLLTTETSWLGNKLIRIIRE